MLGEKWPKRCTWGETVANIRGFASAWGSRKWVFGVKMHRIDLQKCDPHRGQEALFQKKSEKYSKWWKKAPKGKQLAHVMRMLGALVRPRAAEPISNRGFSLKKGATYNGNATRSPQGAHFWIQCPQGCSRKNE